MTFEERYPEQPLGDEAESHFWYVLHDMWNVCRHLQTRDKDVATHMNGALWAIQWIANTQGHLGANALMKLWANTVEGTDGLPKRIPPLPPPGA